MLARVVIANREEKTDGDVGAWGLNDPRNQKCSVGYQHTSVKWLYDVSLLEDIVFQGYDLAVPSTMPGETSRSNGNDIGWPLHRWQQDDVFRVRFCQGYLLFSTTGYFLTNNDINVHFYICTISHLYLEHLYESKHVLKCFYTNHQFIIQRSTPMG